MKILKWCKSTTTSLLGSVSFNYKACKKNRIFFCLRNEFVVDVVGSQFIVEHLRCSKLKRKSAKIISFHAYRNTCARTFILCQLQSITASLASPIFVVVLSTSCLLRPTHIQCKFTQCQIATQASLKQQQTDIEHEFLWKISSLSVIVASVCMATQYHAIKYQNFNNPFKTTITSKATCTNFIPIHLLNNLVFPGSSYKSTS